MAGRRGWRAAVRPPHGARKISGGKNAFKRLNGLQCIPVQGKQEETMHHYGLNMIMSLTTGIVPSRALYVLLLGIIRENCVRPLVIVSWWRSDRGGLRKWITLIKFGHGHDIVKRVERDQLWERGREPLDGELRSRRGNQMATAVTVVHKSLSLVFFFFFLRCCGGLPFLLEAISSRPQQWSTTLSSSLYIISLFVFPTFFAPSFYNQATFFSLLSFLYKMAFWV